MRINETVLTPIYRLILDTIERNGPDHIEQSKMELRQFAEHIQETDEEVQIRILHSTDAERSRRSVLDDTLQLLEACGEEWEKLQLVWNQIYRKIKKLNCVNCYSCEQCREYYWKELGELFCKCDNDDKKEGRYLPIRKIPERIERCLESSRSVSDLYASYVQRERKTEDNYILVLKGISSSTPSILNSLYDTGEFGGGGFFFRYQGHGVAVDPGYQFIRNLHHYGLSVLDIDTVMITHEHIDHNNDMRLLDDLFSSVCRNAGHQRQHKLIWIMDQVSYKIAKVYQENETGFQTKTNELYFVEDGLICNEHQRQNTLKVYSDIELEITFFQTRHIQRKSDKSFAGHTFGIKFYFGTLNRRVTYTSDTSFYPELVDLIGENDILIANISGIYEDDFLLVKGKERHLGYNGCYRLVKDGFQKFDSYPEILLISEFWNGKNDIRYDVTNQLMKDFAQLGIDKIKVLPAEVGMMLDVKELKVQCSQCGRMVKDFLVQRPQEYNGKIHLLCTECCY